MNDCKMSSVRWAFNLSKWEPTEHEFSLAISCLQVEEKNRLDKFVYKKDVKASLIGRLMMRKFVSENTGIPYNSIKFSRDVNNKPIYDSTLNVPHVSFNVSHHGSFTVLAGEMGKKNIGVDLMKLEYKGGKTIKEFFHIMNKNFTTEEWQYIRGTSKCSEQNQVANFCRNWALKESYTKALGIGLTTDLRKLNFIIQSELKKDYVTLDTSLYINNNKQDFTFEESLLDSSHCVAVALDTIDYNCKLSCNNLFHIISYANLLENSIPLSALDFEYSNRFFFKQSHPI